VTASCHTCSAPLETVEHADAGPARAYCGQCAGCDPDGDPLSCDAMCDACGSLAAGDLDGAARIRVAASL